jgi:hypothetical protein
MFTSQLRFSPSSSTHAPIFIVPSITLFPESSADTLSLLDKTSPAASNLFDSNYDHLATSHIPESS